MGMGMLSSVARKGGILFPAGLLGLVQPHGPPAQKRAYCRAQCASGGGVMHGAVRTPSLLRRLLAFYGTRTPELGSLDTQTNLRRVSSKPFCAPSQIGLGTWVLGTCLVVLRPGRSADLMPFTLTFLSKRVSTVTSSPSTSRAFLGCLAAAGLLAWLLLGCLGLCR